MQFEGRRYDDGLVVRITIDAGRISQLEPGDPRAKVPWLAPGFVDLQVNGYRGQEFNALGLTTDQVLAVCTAMDADGVTSFLPTSTTHSFERQSAALAALARACDENVAVARRVPGFHLKGPYISPADGPRAANLREQSRPHCLEEFERHQ